MLSRMVSNAVIGATFAGCSGETPEPHQEASEASVQAGGSSGERAPTQTTSLSN